MTPKRTKTVKVKGVGLCNPTGKKWIGYVSTYGRYGEWSTKREATEQVNGWGFGSEVNVDCTITFQLPNRRTNTKGRKP